MSTHSEATRAHVAWLLWCANQGYINAEDRAVNGNNFVTEMSQHPDDRRELPHWLGMADELLAAIDAEVATHPMLTETELELWDLVEKWRGVAISDTRGPYLSTKPETAYGQGLTQCADELADAILAAEER